MRFKILFFTIPVLSLLGACSSDPTLPSSGYRTARAQATLELPPDLVNSSAKVVQQAANQKPKGALASIAGVDMRSSGDRRWLEVTADAETTWVKLVDYFNKSGLPILTENKRDAILETDWIGDETTASYSSSVIRAKVGNLFGRAPVNDRYTAWLEKIDDEHTSVHVSAKQLKQYIIEPKGQRKDTIKSGWVETDGDELKEVKLLREIAAYLGGAEIETTNSARVVLIQTIPPYILLAESDSDKAWTLVERAIITSPYTLSDQDRENALFKIKAPKESGFWSAITPSSKYGVRVEQLPDAPKTRISITTTKGRDTIDREEALPVLWSLSGELRRLEGEDKEATQ